MIIYKILREIPCSPHSLWHEVGPLLRPVVPLHVLQEAKEDGVDGHLVDVEEDVGDGVGAEDDHQDGEEVVVEVAIVAVVAKGAKAA